MPYKNPPPCQVCGRPSAARRLCEKHYRRFMKFGDVETTLRPDDWGERSNHPLFHTYYTVRRCREGYDPRWNDFRSFVADVGAKPAGHALRRCDIAQPFGPSNFRWVQPLQGRHYSLETAEGRREYARRWRANNRLRSKHHDLKRSHGITLDDYHRILEKQGGSCAICQQGEGVFSHLAVDHCHETKAIRGLLCSRCNRALGGFRDSPDILKRAIKYLRRPPASA